MLYVKTILALIPLLIKLVDWIREASKDDPVKFLTDLDEAIHDIKTTKDPAKIQALIRRI